MSNLFGKWTKDEFDLPSFAYTLNQYAYQDPNPMASPIFNKKNDHYAQIGNDNIIGIPSNYGYMRIREDEGGPKFLNDYDESRDEYAGGFGYLKYGSHVLSTYYFPDSDMDRYFGAGYFRKVVRNQDVTIEQNLYAPFGTDPVMKDDVAITNQTDQTIEADYYEYFGTSMLQFSSRGFNTYRIGEEIGGIDESTNTTDPIRIADKDHTARMLAFRRAFDQNFARSYEAEDGIAACARIFEGYRYPENIAKINEVIPACDQDRTAEDLKPPVIFMTYMHDDDTEIMLDARNFFHGSLKAPYGLSHQPGTEKNGFVMRTHITIKAHETIRLSYLYGYVYDRHDAAVLRQKYTGYTLADSIRQFKAKNIVCETEEDWVKRETLWNSIYLRQSLTYDTYFKEHILSQGGFYQYIWGFQGAIRDQIQHALPFVFFEPKYLKEIIIFSLRQIRPSGRLPWAETGYGMEYSGGFEASDQELYVIWAICEYVMGTKDYSFLDEVIEPAYPDAEAKTVRVYLKQCMEHFIHEIGLGYNGFVRIVTGDWSDSIIRENVPEEKKPDAFKVAESGFNTTMCIYILKMYADIMKEDDPASAAEAEAFSEDQRQKVLKAWNGKWFPRAIYRDQIIGGDEEIWLEPQTWLLIGEVLSQKEADKLLANIRKYCMDTSVIGAKKRHKLVPDPNEKKPSDRVWWSVNGLLIWGMMKYNPALAMEEWKKNSLHNHEIQYPGIWYGIWSGSEAYESTSSKYAGYARYNEALLQANREGRISYGSSYNDFPVNIIHPHAWPLYTMAKLTGLEFTRDGLMLDGMPSEPLAFHSPLYEYAYDGRKITLSYHSQADQSRILLKRIPYKEIFIDGKKADPQQLMLGNEETLTIVL